MTLILLDLAVVLALIGADQAIKAWATAALAPVESMPFIPYVLELRYLLNRGAAFSMLNGQQLVLLVITGIAMAGVAYYLFAKCREPQKRWERVALILILAGGLGNFIDRALHGQVVDYFNCLFMEFPVFNFADICICVGVALLVLCILTEDSRKQKEAAKENKA